MRFLSVTLMLAASFAPTILGFSCLAGQYGECSYQHFNSDGSITRCAIECVSTALGVDCTCPSTYPGTSYALSTTGCITLGKYNDRHKCYWRLDRFGEAALASVRAEVDGVPWTDIDSVWSYVSRVQGGFYFFYSDGFLASLEDMFEDCRIYITWVISRP